MAEKPEGSTTTGPFFVLDAGSVTPADTSSSRISAGRTREEQDPSPAGFLIDRGVGIPVWDPSAVDPEFGVGGTTDQAGCS